MAIPALAYVVIKSRQIEAWRRFGEEVVGMSAH
ncbi:MAG: hypothetical protein RLZZ415_33, partial [Pseudomonadota bacterium]